MNVRKMIVGFGAAAVIMLMASAPAFSQHGAHGGMPIDPPGPGPHSMIQSWLTPDQQREVMSIQQEYQKATAETVKRLWAQELQLTAALASDKIDENRVNALVGTINTLRSNLYREQVNMYLKLAKADLMYPVMRGRGMMGRGMGMGMFPGGGMMGFCPMLNPGLTGPGIFEPDTDTMPAE